jgi:hypothetical protein
MQAEDIKPRLITEAETARYIAMSIPFLRIARWRRTGPPFVRIGRSVRYNLDDLNEWLAGRTVVPEDRRRVEQKSPASDGHHGLEPGDELCTVVNAVAAMASDGDPVSIGQVAEALKITRTTASTWLRIAINEGFLRNLETAKFKRARLVPTGKPLPSESKSRR